MLKITLCPEDQNFVIWCVDRKLEDLEKKNARENHGCKGSTKEEEINSTGAECAFARLTNQYWNGSIDLRKNPDVGIWEIKCPKTGNPSLLIRPKDKEETIYVLIYGPFPTYSVVGWMSGKEAREHPESIATDFGHPDRPLAYKVPPQVLHPLTKEELLVGYARFLGLNSSDMCTKLEVNYD